MIKKYIYKEKTYYSEDIVRNMIWAYSHKVFPKEPSENKVEFWEKFDVTYIEEPDPELTEEQKKEQELIKAKIERAEAVSKIKVTVDGMVFDGDETAQTRMGRTISAAQVLGVDSSEKRTWVLADNTVAEPTIAQLAQALKLAGDEQTRLWTVPYEETEEETALAKVGI